MVNISKKPQQQNEIEQARLTEDSNEQMTEDETSPLLPESQPATATWISEVGTPIPFSGFSFELPEGWHGSVYSDASNVTVHALVKRNDQGFVIDCPPSGKGLEAATNLSSETRSFSAQNTVYSIDFQKWTAPRNDPWFFVWVRTGDSFDGSMVTYCIARGRVSPDIEEAMRVMYETWR